MKSRRGIIGKNRESREEAAKNLVDKDLNVWFNIHRFKYGDIPKRS